MQNASLPSNPSVSRDIDVTKTVKSAIKALSRTSLNEYDDKTGEQMHALLVCVICDEHIIGMEPFSWLKKETILQHRVRLSVKGYEDFIQDTLSR